jgi:protein SCO1/2
VARAALTLVLLLGLAAPAPAANEPALQPGEGKKQADPDIGFEPTLGAEVPLDIKFRNEAAEWVSLGDCVAGKPTVLVLAYYRCPMLCTEVLNGLTEAMRGMDLTVGKDFNVVTVSIDPKEPPGLAAEKKKHYLEAYGRPGAEAGWHFLTGQLPAIKRLADAVGFRFKFDKVFKEYNHPTGVIVLTASGKVSQYFTRTRFEGEYDTVIPGGKTTLKMALVEAGEGKVGSLLDQIMVQCYRFDHFKQGYAFDVLRVVRAGGILTVVLLAVGVTYFVRRDRHRAAVGPATKTESAGEPTGRPAEGVS